MPRSPSKRNICDILQKPEIGTEVVVEGWVRTKRESKAGFAFLEVNDGSFFQNLQVVIPANLSNYATDIPKLYPGSSVFVRAPCDAPRAQTYEEMVDDVGGLARHPLGALFGERARELIRLFADLRANGQRSALVEALRVALLRGARAPRFETSFEA